MDYWCYFLQPENHKNVWQFYRSEKAGTCAKSIYPVCSCSGSDHIRNGTYAGTVFHRAGNRDNRNERLQYGRECATELPTEIVDKIETWGMLESIPLWIVTLLGSLLITVLSFVMILTVYQNVQNLYVYGNCPDSDFLVCRIPRSPSERIYVSYIGVCLEGAIIALGHLFCLCGKPSGCRGIQS